MRLDLSPLDQFFQRTTWPLIVGCKHCFPDVDMTSCDTVAAVAAWTEAHADLPHDNGNFDLTLISPLRKLPPGFFGPGIGSPL